MRNQEGYYGYDDAERANRRRKPRKSFARRFFKALFIILSVFVLLFSAAVFGYTKLFGENPISAAIAKAIDSNLNHNNSPLDVFDPIPRHTNFVILGVDNDGTRTDLIMFCSFDSETGALDIISVPRDTYAVIPRERRDVLKENGRPCPASGEMKMNAVYHYAGRELGVEFAVKQIEETLGVEINYYIKLDLEAFRGVIDEIGGVEFDVPQRMYYNDPQQNLYIDLQPGLQILNGKQAEGLVRYRKADSVNPVSPGYSQADIKRVEVQQEFLKAMFSQLLSKKNIVKNAPGLFTTAAKYLKTNFSATDVMRYAPLLAKISSETMRSYTMPHAIGDVGAVNYVIPDEAAIAELIGEILGE